MKDYGSLTAYVASFLAGATVMAVEFLASRWIAPLFGSSLSTWSIIIGVTLLACSLGAWLGGVLSKGLTGWRGVGYCFLAIAAWLVLLRVGFGGLRRVLIARALLPGTAIAAIILILPPVALASMLLPFLVHLRREGLAAGLTVGRLSACSSLGSLAGTLGTGLWMIPFLGLRTSTILLAILLAGFGFLPLIKRGRSVGAVILLLVVTGAGTLLQHYGAQPGADRVVRETPYGIIELQHSPFNVSLRVNGILQTEYSPPFLRRGALIGSRNYFELLPYLRPDGRTVLHIGLGAGLVPRCLAFHGLVSDNVDISPLLVHMVRRYLGFEEPITVGDGRYIIRTSEKQYDFVILDVFNGESLATQLMTQEAFAEIRDRLTPDGVLNIHLIGVPDHIVTSCVVRTLKTIFSHVLCAQSGIGDELQHLYLFASVEPLELPEDPELEEFGWLGNEVFDPDLVKGLVLTDDHNPLEHYNAPLAAALRRSERRSPI